MGIRYPQRPLTGDRASRGLTLVELVVVLAIIAILLGAGFLGLLSWLGTDNVNVAQARVRTALQLTMASALTNPPSSTTPYHNWSLQLVTQGGQQDLYVCTGSHGGCAGNTNPAAGPVQVRVSAVPANVHLTINQAALTCLAFGPLGQPLLGATTPATASAGACYWPAAVSGQWTFQASVTGGAAATDTYVF
ncbi:prepilin-type N-terminal cleavage/methylation domain-containing protein [Acidiferrobacter sp.]|uniref:prepilin-type N-terminal cleavage/methylation domain-containing protein n=1 Tax=Acidiferrobacter sp. TaxID=1872107 RepID=UPI002611FB41|nr:prepilin-type N-terminal cleavage/methylation domain-containing protein [Acidiferrobacter sp.]